MIASRLSETLARFQLSQDWYVIYQWPNHLLSGFNVFLLFSSLALSFCRRLRSLKYSFTIILMEFWEWAKLNKDVNLSSLPEIQTHSSIWWWHLPSWRFYSPNYRCSNYHPKPQTITSHFSETQCSNLNLPHH